MMEVELIEKDLKKFILENILSGNVAISNELMLQDLGVDSYSVVEIILFIERKYKLSVPNDKLSPSNFESINAIAKTVSALL